MQCTPEQIAAKRQMAIQRLAEKNKLRSPLRASDPDSPQPKIPRFTFRDPSKLHQKPYEKPEEKPKTTSNVFGNDKVITGSCALVSETRFRVEVGYSQVVIDVFKTIPSKNYDPKTRSWDFHVKDHKLLMSKLSQLGPTAGVKIEPLPNFVINCVTSPPEELMDIDFGKIEPELFNTLMPFQIDGVRYGIERNGRCFIADDMGLGKTFQALAIAHYYYEDWPLLIVTTATMTNALKKTIYEYLPSISPFQISYMGSGRDYIDESQILIVSYDQMTRSVDKLKTRKFGVIIFDESHALKNSRAKCTKAACDLGRIARRVVLLSGTPALSRPSELYSQLDLIDNKFFGNFFTYSKRYCDGQQGAFGWDASGKSNLQELEIILRKKFMIRRIKEDVLKALPNKKQEVVKLNVNLNEFSETDKLVLNALSEKYSQKSGREKHKALLTFFQETARLKIPSVCSYILQILQNKEKFIVFAHHQVMMNAIAKILEQKDIRFIRIDGNTKPEQRKFFVDRFQDDDNCMVALLSITSANAGITLTSAKLVVFAELHWNPSILSQAESRAHRIGQSCPVIAQYLLAHGTADDAIWHLLQNKQKILGEIGLLKDSFTNVDVKNQRTNKEEQLTEDLNITITPANTKDIASYFISPPENTPQENKENGANTSRILFEDDGMDDVLSSIEF